MWDVKTQSNSTEYAKCFIISHFCLVHQLKKPQLYWSSRVERYNSNISWKTHDGSYTDTLSWRFWKIWQRSSRWLIYLCSSTTLDDHRCTVTSCDESRCLSKFLPKPKHLFHQEKPQLAPVASWFHHKWKDRKGKKHFWAGTFARWMRRLEIWEIRLLCKVVIIVVSGYNPFWGWRF